MDELTETQVYCPVCWEPVPVRVDVSAGAQQRYIEDCSVCCNPMWIHIHVDAEGGVEVSAHPGNS